MRFITNFANEQTAIYLAAIKRSGETTLTISPIARVPSRNLVTEIFRPDSPFDGTSKVLEGRSSLWDGGRERDLSAFWRVFDAVKQEMTTVVK